VPATFRDHAGAHRKLCSISVCNKPDHHVSGAPCRIIIQVGPKVGIQYIV